MLCYELEKKLEHNFVILFLYYYKLEQPNKGSIAFEYWYSNATPLGIAIGFLYTAFSHGVANAIMSSKSLPEV